MPTCDEATEDVDNCSRTGNEVWLRTYRESLIDDGIGGFGFVGMLRMA